MSQHLHPGNCANGIEGQVEATRHLCGAKSSALDPVAIMAFEHAGLARSHLFSAQRLHSDIHPAACQFQGCRLMPLISGGKPQCSFCAPCLMTFVYCWAY